MSEFKYQTVNFKIYKFKSTVLKKLLNNLNYINEENVKYTYKNKTEK